MRFKRLRRQFIIQAGIAGITAICGGCGTVLHPERIGQTRGKIDWRIAALDAAGLLLFFVPGVIAFAVDFYQGTIFLPPGEDFIGGEGEPNLQQVDLPGNRIDRQAIETVISQRIGRRVNLQPGTFRTKRIAKIDEFWSSVRQFCNAPFSRAPAKQDQA